MDGRVATDSCGIVMDGVPRELGFRELEYVEDMTRSGVGSCIVMDGVPRELGFRELEYVGEMTPSAVA